MKGLTPADYCDECGRRYPIEDMPSHKRQVHASDRGYILYLQSNGTVVCVDDPEPEAPRCAGCGLQTHHLANNKYGVKICAMCAAPKSITIGNLIHALSTGESLDRYDRKPNGWRPGQ